MENKGQSGLIYDATIMHVPQHLDRRRAIALVGLGILTGGEATRQEDPGA